MINEASTWRQALAQQIVPHYGANLKVAAVAVEGSVAQGCADRFSDIDLAVFCAGPPTKKERRDVIARVGGRLSHLLPSDREGDRWSERYEMGGVTIDVRHTTVETMERLLADVLEWSDLSLAKQQRLAALLSALPLANPALVSQWQQKATAYPHELTVAMVREHLLFRPGIKLEMLAERNDLLVLYDCLCAVEKHILLVLMGLNRIYYPGFRWIDRLMGQMHITPPNLSTRFKQLFGIVGMDPLAGVYQLHELIEETFSLVETHLSEFDTAQMRERFQGRGQTWEHVPDGLMEGT
jgi:predicted nucleotidyltransferase